MTDDYRRWICATCKHWDHRGKTDDHRRRCYRIRPVNGDLVPEAVVVPTKPTREAVVSLADTAVETSANFGCRLWERK